MIRQGALLLAIALAASACSATYRNFRTREVSPWPPEASSLGSPIALRLYGSARFETAAADPPAELLPMLHEEAVRAYGESGVFDSVVGPWTEDVWVAEVSFSLRSDARLRAEDLVLVRLRYRAVQLLMRTRFRDPEGRSRGVIEVAESFRIFIDPLAFPLALVRPRDRIMREAIRDLHRATLAEAQAKGLLGPAEAALPRSRTTARRADDREASSALPAPL